MDTIRLLHVLILCNGTLMSIPYLSFLRSGEAT